MLAVSKRLEGNGGPTDAVGAQPTVIPEGGGGGGGNTPFKSVGLGRVVTPQLCCGPRPPQRTGAL